MKIFNWVHRKFHQNVDNYSVCPKKDGLAPEEKKLETVTISEREALLEHVKFVEMIDGWKDGILTIGTFGFDLPDEQNEYSVDNNQEMCRGEEYSVTDEEEKVNPIVVTAFKQEFQKVLAGSNLDYTSVGVHRLSTNVDDVPLLQFLESPQVKSEIEIENNNMKKRTTLAELFSADSNVVTTEKSDPGEKQPDLGKNPVKPKKSSPSFAKKFLPSKGGDQDSRSIKKISRLVTKMLKKKIHPDLEGRTNSHGKEGSSSIKDQPKTRMVEATSKHGTIEKVSLLQDAVAVAQL